MSMSHTQTRAFASPGKYIQGPRELERLEKYTNVYGNQISMVIDGFLYKNIKATLNDRYSNDNIIKNILSSVENVRSARLLELKLSRREYRPM